MTEFTGKNKKELFKTMADKRQALQDFRFGVSGGKAKNVKLGRTIRKDIARIQTEISIQNRAGLPTTAASKTPTATKTIASKKSSVRKSKSAK